MDKQNTPGEKYQDIGRRLKSIRDALGYTLDRVYKETGISRSYISEFERGRKLATSKYLKFLIDTHNVNLNFVFTGKGEMFISHQDRQPELYDFGKFDEEIKDLLFHITNVPNAMYEVLGHFSEYKMRKADLIKQALLTLNKESDSSK
ncbi:MAG: helix-turn-helix transcriptional regulator [Candidatus Aminicenantes bacterium]|nr:helix-turn-helix transcriptional regulator [Candidatus Aminicenantes bacterium]